MPAGFYYLDLEWTYYDRAIGVAGLLDGATMEVEQLVWPSDGELLSWITQHLPAGGRLVTFNGGNDLSLIRKSCALDLDQHMAHTDLRQLCRMYGLVAGQSGRLDEIGDRLGFQRHCAVPDYREISRKLKCWLRDCNPDRCILNNSGDWEYCYGPDMAIEEVMDYNREDLLETEFIHGYILDLR